MAVVKLYDLARMTTATVGTGTITLGVAVSPYLSFVQAGVQNGDTVRYAIYDPVNGGSEIGSGVYTASGTTLTRSPTTSTANNGAINLSGQAQVFITAGQNDFPNRVLGSFWSDNGSDTPAPIYYVRDRLFVDDGALAPTTWNGGVATLPNTRGAAALNTVGGGWPNLYLGASIFALSSKGLDAIVGVTVTSLQATPIGAGSNYGIGIIGMGLSDNTVQSETAWGGYFEGLRTATIGWAYGVEIAIGNTQSVQPISVYGNNTQITTGLQIDAGGAAGAGTTYTNSSAALTFISNGGNTSSTPAFDRGVVFLNNSVADQGGGVFNAVNFPNNYRINWWRNNSSVDQLNAFIAANNTNVGQAVQSLTFGAGPLTTLSTAQLLIDAGSGAFTGTPPAGTTLHLAQANSTSLLTTADVFGTGIITGYIGQLAGGTRASPTAAPAATEIVSFAANGYDGTSAYGTVANIQFETINQTSTTDHSGLIRFRTVATATTGTPVTRMLIQQGVLIGSGSTDPGANNLLISGGNFGITGNQSLAAWTTNGARYANVPGTLTDTTSSGTVAAVYDSVFGGNTIAASSATTYTLAVGSYFKVPVTGTNVTFTSAYALGTDSLGVVGGTLAPGAQAFNLSATQPASPTGPQKASEFSITSAGSAAQANQAVRIDYLAGYTGSSRTDGFFSSSLVSGTGTTLIPASGANTFIGNDGGIGSSSGTTTGYNVGLIGIASAGAVNAGIVGLAQIGKASSTNIGGAFSAINSGGTNAIGVWAALNQTTVPSVSAALIADNGSQSNPVALFQVNAVTKFSINAKGNPTFTVYTVSTLPSGPVNGDVALVSDATSNVVIGAGGGSAYALVAYNGSAWVAV